MKKVVYIVMMFILILVGCSDGSASKELVDYEKDKVVNSLNELSFNPEIPNSLPFEPIEIRVDVMDMGGRKNNFINVSFINENQEEVTFSAGRSQNVLDFTEDKVKIQEGLEGSYGKKNKTKILKWKKNNIYYELFVDSDSTSKEEVLKIAKSIYQIN